MLPVRSAINNKKVINSIFFLNKAIRKSPIRNAVKNISNEIEYLSPKNTPMAKNIIVSKNIFDLGVFSICFAFLFML